MEIVNVLCLGKTLGIGKGLKLNVLDNGENIGNILIVDSLTEDKIGVVLYSVMLKTIFGKYRISDLVDRLNSGDIIVI
jgi:hypothetical protein